jgi:hypothetical protein
MNAQPAILVIYGLGKDQKPRAARFGAQDEEVALRAAHAMGLGIGRAENPEAVTLAKRLPEGKPFATGKSLLPLAGKDLYQRLIKAITPMDPAVLAKFQEKAVPATAPASEASGQLIPNPWAAITVGSTVLCLDPEPGPERSYWPAVVTEIPKDGRTLFLRWRSFPTPKPFSAKRIAVGLIAKVQ